LTINKNIFALFTSRVVSRILFFCQVEKFYHFTYMSRCKIQYLNL